LEIQVCELSPSREVCQVHLLLEFSTKAFQPVNLLAQGSVFDLRDIEAIWIDQEVP
jgi:hypothetical protein